MEKKKSGLAVASLTLGILSIILFGFWYMALPTGVLAIIFGNKSVKKYGSGMAKAGIITAIIGLSIFALYYVAALLIIFFE